MNITILHNCWLGQPHLARIRKHGRLILYQETSSEKDAIKRLHDAHVAVINCSLLPITARMLESAKHLKYISLVSTGFDPVDVDYAKLHGITISNLPTYGTESVAEHAISLMFALCRHITRLDMLFRKKPYEINFLPEPTAHQYCATNLHGKTLGIIGIGRIGERVAQIAQTLGMKVLSYDAFPRNIKGVNGVTLKKLLRESDVITIHSPLNKETKGMIGKNEIALMKASSVFINTARGGLVDEDALYKALKHRRIAGAGLDVMANLKKDNPLLALPNVVFTPHSAWYSDQSCSNIAETVTENIESFIKGQPINVIS